MVHAGDFSTAAHPFGQMSHALAQARLPAYCPAKQLSQFIIPGTSVNVPISQLEHSSTPSWSA